MTGNNQTTEIRKAKTNLILNSPFELEINDMRTAGKELKDICAFMWNERKFKISPASLTRYFQLKKELGKTATKDVENHLKTVYKEEYMDLVGRVTFFNEVILEAKKRFQIEKQNLTLLDLMNLATRMGDSLQRIEGADAQGDLIRQFATLILEAKMEPHVQKLPIIEVSPDGSSHEIFE